MKRVLVAVLFASLTAGCGLAEGEVDTHEEPSFTDSEDALGATVQSYVTARRDYRKCISPLCGGYWVHDVNRQVLNERYVSGFDFTASGLSEDDVARVLGAGDNELILKGKLGPVEPNFNTRQFLVSEAYRGMPGVTPVAGEAFFVARSTDRVCKAAPCHDEDAKRLNHAGFTPFTSYNVSRALKSHVDGKWLSSRVEFHGAIVAGKIRNGKWYSTGYEKVLDASQVFVRIPEMAGPCPLVKMQACADGKTYSHYRTADRCVLPTACVIPGACTKILPVCDEGYVSNSWSGGAAACPVYACDPEFTVY